MLLLQVYLVVAAAMVVVAMVDSDAVLFRSTGSFMVVRSSSVVFAQIWSAVCAAGALHEEDYGFGSGACCCNGSLRVQRLLVCTVKIAGGDGSSTRRRWWSPWREVREWCNCGVVQWWPASFKCGGGVGSEKMDIENGAAVADGDGGHRGARSVNGAIAAWCSGGRRVSNAVVVLAARRWISKMVRNGGGCRGGSWWRLGF
ncbi:hypothetical protein DEO72_LG7g992 [Vigna unguiculata]|uniref:Secreted protein n=1 Tax=Vigna unguiculata TaxID=3917 RepID=A0A4D6MHJ5_VIGUN|nr:hypothetical protein DEO72_LG7g992 [Vigna unguiculata]